MIQCEKINGILFSDMVAVGASTLRAHAKEVNDLNVFPIPDGDTGDNMLLTVLGGVDPDKNDCKLLSEASRRISGGMLLSARGNSGVILSQFFEGMTRGFSDIVEAGAKELGNAFREGVSQAYKAVIEPTEGTVLTVLREATEYACVSNASTPSEFFDSFIDEAKRSLKRTPSLLPVLKKAGVVDSGGAGIIYIIEGMRAALQGEEPTDLSFAQTSQELDLDAFGEDSVLEFGYCTELLLRLQNAKTSVENFDVKILTDYLSGIGNSIVAVKNGSIVKLHVHTMTPDRVLSFCQKYGEFLKVKIENMSLQHNNTVMETKDKDDVKETKERKAFGVIAVASGEGVKQTFRELGADVVVDGGQSMNPSAEELLSAFDEVCADTIFVYPNNSNIILTAKQAASLYPSSDVRVIESRTLGDGYASISMLDTSSGDADAIEKELTDAMNGVITAEVSRCIRNTEIDGTKVSVGDYIGFSGKDLIAASSDRKAAVCATIDSLGLSAHDICIIIRGKDAPSEEAEQIKSHITTSYRGKEVYIIDGMQDIYDYVLIVE